MVTTRVGDVVKLTWQQQGCGGGVHEGYIPLQWLKQHDYSDYQLNKRRKQARPTPAPMVNCSFIAASSSYSTPGSSS